MPVSSGIPSEPEYTGKYIVTFREGAHADALSMLKKGAGLAKAKIVSSSDFAESGIDIEQVPDDGGVVFENLGVAVVRLDEDAAGALTQDAGEDSLILAVEPEGFMYALDNEDYLRGFRDATNAICAGIGQTPAEGQDAEIEAVYNDTAVLTWGLQATKVNLTRFSGRGMKVAVLDTGFDLRHPDFKGRTIVQRSFVPGVPTAQDGHGHGTHCIGTACGPLKPVKGRRYGIAYGSIIYTGKVLSDQGSGQDSWILAGIDWAVANKVQVVSMSLGGNAQTTSVAYETIGQRALNAGVLIVAAAGNNADRSRGLFGFVGRPANSRTFMAVGAVDANLRIANFSARDTVRQPGTAVDIAGSGVNVYSSWPMPTQYKVISGTSMATPHVSGIAALFAEKTGLRGAGLWQAVVSSARPLLIPAVDVGRGLVQAP